MKHLNKKAPLLLSLLGMMLAGCGKDTNSQVASSQAESNTHSDEASSEVITHRIIEGQMIPVDSPNGELEVQVILSDFGELYYQVIKGNTSVVEYSKLGFECEEVILDQLLELKDYSIVPINTLYENKTGRHSTVNVTANELTLKMSDGTYDLDVVFRVYDDGFAFRYNIDTEGSEKTLHVVKEDSEFAIPYNSTAWTMNFTQIPNSNSNPNCFAYEENYMQRTIDSIVDSYVSLPMIYKAGNTDIYCHITESELIGSGYYGSFLTGDPEDKTRSILHTVHSPASNNIDKESEKEISLPFSSPWRVGTVGTLAQITNAELTEAVYGDTEYWKPDNYDSLTAEEKDIYSYDWVEAGDCAWSWLRYTGKRPQTDFTLHEEYLDHAIDMGWKYMILDGGWNGASDYQNLTKKLTERAHANGIKVLGWVNALDFNKGTSVAALKSLLKSWNSMGIDGIKIDFFDGQTVVGGTIHQGEDKQTIQWYETIYQECAKLKMVVNCHGANKPTGERRKYPNVINREAIRGNEMSSVSSQTIVNSLYTRALVGPTDWTPTVLPKNKSISKAEMMGLSILYESGSVSMSGTVDEYKDESIKGFWKNLPSAWDDSAFIAGNVGQYITMARKKGQKWYVGCVSALESRDVQVDFSYLDDGVNYTATVYKDGEDFTSITKEIVTVNKNSKITIPVLKNGGFAIEISK